jgi:ADP-L-glycero-D-manno-heptose 6-epimerase
MIIVTGGAGFIGSNLVRGLNERGVSDILIVDNLKNSQKLLNLNSLNFSDYLDKSFFIQNIDSFKGKKIDTVFHQGACTDTMEYDGRYMMENNYEYSKRILNFCQDNRIRLIYASSASVYGDGKRGFVEERTNEYPLNIYAFSKFLFDQLVRRTIHERSPQIAGLRYFNVYGPQENHKGKMASVVFHFHNQISKEKRVKLFEGSDNFFRDFIYVKDVIDVCLFFFENPRFSGIYNCGKGDADSFLHLAEITRSCYGNIEIEYIPFPKELQGKYQTFTKADLQKLRKIGYGKPFTGLREGIKEYVSILQNTGGYLR